MIRLTALAMIAASLVACRPSHDGCVRMESNLSAPSPKPTKSKRIKTSKPKPGKGWHWDEDDCEWEKD